MKKIIFSSEQEIDIINKYTLDYLSLSSIAKLYGVGRPRIKKVLEDYNIESRDDSHKIRHYTINENYFDEINTPNKAYIIGLLWSDGYNCVSKDEVKLVLQARDREILERINDELESNRELKFDPKSKINSNYQDTYRLSIYNKHISQKLLGLGMMQGKSLILEYPEWLDDRLFPHFLRGMIDGDGHISSVRPTIELVGTIMILQRIQEKLLSLNGISSLIKSTNHNHPITKILRINGRQNAKKLLDWLYLDADLFISRKYNAYLSNYFAA